MLSEAAQSVRHISDTFFEKLKTTNIYKDPDYFIEAFISIRKEFHNVSSNDRPFVTADYNKVFNYVNYHANFINTIVHAKNRLLTGLQEIYEEHLKSRQDGSQLKKEITNLVTEIEDLSVILEKFPDDLFTIYEGNTNLE